jgi:glycosyltransferase involved in cell wall biosynthesis
VKILHVIASFPVDYPGGITNYIRTLASGQLAEGHEVDVIDGGGSAPWEGDPRGFRRGSIAATSRIVHVASSHADPAGTEEFVGLVRREGYDIVHFHLTMRMGETLYERMPGLGIPYVVTLHDYYLFCPRITMMNWRDDNCGGPERTKCERCIGVLDQIDPLYRLSRRTKVPLPRILPSSAVTRRNEKIHGFLLGARTVLAISTRMREFFEATYPGLRCVVAHVGTDTAGVTPLPRIAGEKLRFSFIGTLSHHKGADTFLELARRVTRPDVEFHFYGRVLEASKGAQLAASRVTDHGPYTDADLPEIMAATDLGMVLSEWEEGAGLVVMEFLNFGVPVLATRRGGLPDFVGAHNGFVFDPTAAGISQAVEFLETLTPERLAVLAMGIRPLTTPAEHLAVVEAAYTRAQR